MSTRLATSSVAFDHTNTNEGVHRMLAASHTQRLSPALDSADFEAGIQREISMRRVERELVEAERAAIARDVARVPTAPAAFLKWFEALKENGPGQNDALFPWLAESADYGQMRWFLQQELAGEAGFDDLVALTQVKLPNRPKLEMARNYWDEMGQGNEGGMHGPMLGALAQALELGPSGHTVWESLALGNLMVALASARHYAYQSIGALGVIELTAPGRSQLVNAGLKRLGIGGAARRYYALHATLDVRHSATWNREVLEPLVASNPLIARLIAEGALLRLRAGKRCFDRYRRELWNVS
ncbi:MAG TPA: iron-containing redox enzyme family protein [Polyangiaceae bacterium]|nr:iron-containing redox enzyme family protein [Polyangiaceae bacterium]